MNNICALIKTLFFIMILPFRELYSFLKNIDMEDIKDLSKAVGVVILLFVGLVSVIFVPFANCILGTDFLRDGNLRLPTIKRILLIDIFWFSSMSVLSICSGHHIKDIIVALPVLAMTSSMICLVSEIFFEPVIAAKDYIKEKYNDFYVDCSNKN